MMTALVVDDEPHARRSLEAMLAGTGQFRLLPSCATAIDALHAIQAGAPDVVFLDVQMPQVSGLQLLSMLDPEATPAVVFVTAYDEYAVDAFERNAVDYLLKPVERERLDRTVEKLRRAGAAGPPRAFEPPALERIPCTGRSGIRLVSVAEVEHVRCSVAGVYVVTRAGEFFTEVTLQALEAKTDLARCHRQYLVNLAEIEEITRPEPRAAVLRLRSGHSVPVSRRYFPKLRQRLGLRPGGKYLDPLA
jgi:two-component system LytT family response regulator